MRVTQYVFWFICIPILFGCAYGGPVFVEEPKYPREYAQLQHGIPGSTVCDPMGLMYSIDLNMDDSPSKYGYGGIIWIKPGKHSVQYSCTTCIADQEGRCYCEWSPTYLTLHYEFEAGQKYKIDCNRDGNLLLEIVGAVL